MIRLRRRARVLVADTLNSELAKLTALLDANSPRAMAAEFSAAMAKSRTAFQRGEAARALRDDPALQPIYAQLLTERRCTSVAWIDNRMDYGASATRIGPRPCERLGPHDEHQFFDGYRNIVHLWHDGEQPAAHPLHPVTVEGLRLRSMQRTQEVLEAQRQRLANTA
jgi:hypothetical protein